MPAPAKTPNAGCAPSSQCCHAVNYVIDVGAGWQQTVFNLFVCVLGLSSLAGFVYVLLRWQRLRLHNFYYSKVILTMLSMFATIVIYLMPIQGEVEGFAYGQVSNTAFILSLCTLWVVEINVAAFLVSRVDKFESENRAPLAYSVLAVVPLCVGELVGGFKNIQWYFCTATEIVLAVGFAVAMVYFWGASRGSEAAMMYHLAPSTPNSKALAYAQPTTTLHARKEFFTWAWFCLLSHVLLSVNYGLFVWQYKSESGMCMYILGKVVYMGGFMPVLVWVMSRDSKTLNKDGALLLQNRGEEWEEEIAAGGCGCGCGKGAAAGCTCDKHAPAAGETAASASASPRRPPPLVRLPNQNNQSPTSSTSAEYLSSATASSSATPADPLVGLARPGMRISMCDLEMQDQIGAGQYGDVYRALYRGEVVAAKRFRALGKVSRDKLIESFAKEINLVASLEHPNVVRFIGAVFDGSQPEPQTLIMVTEYLPGGSLFDFLGAAAAGETPFPLAQRLSLLRDVAEGMRFLHSKHPIILHRDLKSHNLLLSKPDAEGRVACKICDLGISRLKEATSTMTSVGTPQWMAPEAIRGDRYSEKADVFSFGVVCWEVMSLQRPFPNVAALRVASLVAYEHLRLPIPPDTRPEMRRLMERCWDEKPNKRPSFNEICAELAKMK